MILHDSDGIFDKGLIARLTNACRYQTKLIVVGQINKLRSNFRIFPPSPRFCYRRLEVVDGYEDRHTAKKFQH